MLHLETLGLLLRNKEFLHPNFFFFFYFFALLLSLISWFPVTSQKCLAFHVCRELFAKQSCTKQFYFFVVYIAVNLFINQNFNLK